MTNKRNIVLNYCNTLKYIALRHDKHTRTPMPQRARRALLVGEPVLGTPAAEMSRTMKI